MTADDTAAAALLASGAIEERVVYVVCDANGDDWTFDTRQAAEAWLLSLPEEA